MALESALFSSDNDERSPKIASRPSKSVSMDFKLDSQLIRISLSNTK
jgi:hypothetical protein